MSQRSQFPAGDAGQAQRGREQRAGTAYRFAWLSLLLFPFSLVGAFLLGDGLATLLGVPVDGSTAPPVWVALTVGVPAVLLFSVPALLAALLSRRAARLGRPSPWAPAIVGGVLVIVFCGQNLLSYLAQVLVG